ncbi:MULTISPECIES: hypothetical protein [Pseudidiomarina]|uniref:Uncharacterized protein n=2 Tax=Pseudidiomarina TaxID=2800384 RepID=A0A0K6GXP1_9GAMM|nr:MULTISPECIES: hypothetical protein [Pseudidiomarina]MBR9908145.1 hypothetical protein [Gammaproteobacteria bacterium]RUO49499.1 hypothetical protein CWE24_03100 [Pseudidiomarina donghaiensis]CUA83512.1 hypothetical protein Ga0061064_0642 [Pseudidiomarina woesei]SFV21369.1 hypothetical protein SAMN04488139_0756 [Pseudidiomarina donghaiensis]
MFIALCCLLSALTLYIQALTHAMGAKRWGTMGLLLGPLVLPMFFTHKRMRLLKAQGRASVSMLVR